MLARPVVMLRRLLAAISLSAALCVPAAFAQQADLTVSKTGPEQFAAGTDVTYTVTLTNVGAVATNVALADVIPANMTFISVSQIGGPAFNCTGPGSGNSGTVNCTAATLAGGASAVFELVFAVAGGTPVGTSITNTATASSTPPDANGGNNSGSTTGSVSGAADLTVAKTGPAQAPAGGNVTYDVTVANAGPHAAEEVTLTDVIPAGMTFVDAPATGSPTFTCDTPLPGETGSIVCQAEVLNAGQSATFQFIFQIDPSTPPSTTFTNVATVESITNDPNPENDSAVTSTTTPAPPTGDLGVQKSAPTAAGPDTDITFSITLTNAGPSAATGVTLQDTLPGNLTFVSLDQSGTPLSCTTPAMGAGGTITCTAATYAANATTTLTVIAHVPAGTSSGTTYANTATVSSNNDPNPENNVTTFSVTVSQTDLSVTKDGPATANAGEIAYTIILRNDGPDAASTVQLTDVLPSGTTFVSLVRPATAGCETPPPGSTGTIICVMEALGAGGTAQFTLRIRALNVTSVTNTASVTSDSFDTDTTDNSDSATTNVTLQADLVASKSGPASATPGTNVTYILGVTNSGPSTAANVTLTDTLPPNTTFVSFGQTSGPAFNCTTGSTINCNIATLAVTASATFQLVVQVAPSATLPLANTVSVATTTNDPDATDNDATVNTPLTPTADLGVTKSGPTGASAGTNMTYTIAIANQGPSDAATVALHDVLPANTTFVSIAQNVGPLFTCTTPTAGTNGTVTCSIATFAAGASASFDLTVQVAPTASGSITNTVTRSTTTADPNSANDSASMTTTIGTIADVSTTKSGPANTVAGSNVTYTITVANSGPAVANNVTMTDVLPSQTTFVSLAQTAGPTFNCTTPAVGAGGTVTCTVATLPLTSATFALTVNVPATFQGTLTNTSTVTSTTGDPTPANGSATAQTTVVPQTTDLGITKSASVTTATLGETITYTIVVTNLGPNNATETTVTDVLPAGTTFVSATATQGTCTGTTTVICTLGTLTPNATATITLAVRLPQSPGPVANTATVTATQFDSAAPNNASTTTITVAAAGPSEIPTLSEWMLALLAAAIAIIAIRLRM